MKLNVPFNWGNYLGMSFRPKGEIPGALLLSFSLPEKEQSSFNFSR
jgi:hypothetical protein